MRLDLMTARLPGHPAASMSTAMVDARGVADLVGDRLSIDVIRRELETERIGSQIFLFGDVSSTTDALRRLAETGAREGTVVLAESQNAGRGRQGARWLSPPGGNLYASVLLRPALAPAAVAGFAFIVSLALSDAIWAEGVPAAIKWPNDILIDGRKVAGALAAYAVSGERIQWVILGVGVNLNCDRAALEATLGAKAAAAASVREAAGRLIDRNRFAATYLNCLEKWADLYDTSGADVVLAAWRARDALTGRRIMIDSEGISWRGRVLGANHHGGLVIEDEAGALHEVLTGRITRLD